MPYSPSGERELVPILAETLSLPGDAALLQHFLDFHDESAFAALVERYGPMVLATCRRQLGNSSDADDAFQATFLVLVRKAASITKRNHVGPWLYRVACLTSGKLRLSAQRQRLRDQQVRFMPEPSASSVDSVEVRDELALLDQAMAELPEKLRVPLVLCELQGVSRREAANRLQISEGTLSSRLARGRALLRRRLAAYFGVFTIAMLIALLLRARAPVVVPPNLAQGTLKAASDAVAIAALNGAASTAPQALAEGVIKTMLLSKLKLLTVATLSVCVLGGLGVLIYANAPAGVNQAKADPIPVEGIWVAVADGGEKLQGQPVPAEGVWVAVGEEGAPFQGKAAPDARAEQKTAVEGVELFVPVGPGHKPDKR
ncbi:MAG TPA: sigma-70 family RNA polymerase sigma factor [Gemmatales bacterium]|nr:sigma-70 family RNA polymerase sigma factor [Gemmatales bacterium]